MKKVLSRTLVLAVALSVASYMLAAEQGSWTGWVTETHCAEKEAKEGHADCAKKCVKEKGAKWALYNPTDKSVFVLSGKWKSPRAAASARTSSSPCSARAG